jgi:hypothetical protein
MVANKQKRFWTEWWQTNRRDFGLNGGKQTEEILD